MSGLEDIMSGARSAMKSVKGVLSDAGSALEPIGLGLGVASQVLGGVSAAEQGKAQAKAYAANADIALQQARNQAAQEQDKYKRLAASQRASFGASGVDVNSGSPLDVLADTDAEGAVSAMQMLYGGQLEAANWRQRAASARASGNQALLGGMLGGMTNLALGAAKLQSGSKSPSGSGSGKAR